MAIEKKLIHFGKLADFEAQLTAGNILDRSIVFIQDAKKTWTHGTYYDCNSDIKQDVLVSGTNIKTINGESILGEGNLALATKTSFQQFTDVVYAQAIEGGNFVYALPDQANGDEDDILLSRQTVKTINGESIVGSGDIEVGKTNYVELSGASVTISSMLEDTFYYDTTPLTSLTISAFTSSGNPKGEYKAVFKAADGMSLTLPSDVYWANGTIPDIEANVLYELSIERGLDIYKAVLVPFKSV